MIKGEVSELLIKDESVPAKAQFELFIFAF